MAEHLILIDCSGFAYRAYYSSAPTYREDGLPTWATLGFLSMVWNMLGAARVDQPTMGVAVFDPPGKTFRHKLYPQYKANRPDARRQELAVQFPFMKHAADTLGLTPLEVADFEADDTMATLARLAMLAGIRVTIVTSDKDLGQTIVDDRVEVVDPMQKARWRAADIEKKFGVPPHLMPDLQALAGDAVDGIPGIRGLGLKKGGGLIRRFGSLEGVLENADKCRWPQVRSELKRGAKQARLYLKLTTLRQDVPLAVNFEDYRLRPIMKAHLLEIVRSLEAEARFESLFGLDPQLDRVVERLAEPLEWWREELLASGQPIPDVPQCGFYKRKLVKGAAWVPCRIFRVPEIDALSGKDTGKDVLRCHVDGKPRDPLAEWTRLSMYPVKESDFHFETADIAHAKEFRPLDPKADPRRKIDFMTIPTPTLKRRRRI